MRVENEPLARRDLAGVEFVGADLQHAGERFAADGMERHLRRFALGYVELRATALAYDLAVQ